jgi:hypothetical protein
MKSHDQLPENYVLDDDQEHEKDEIAELLT